jgi:hypothetical protein
LAEVSAPPRRGRFWSATAAKPVLPELRELLKHCQTEDFPEDCKRQKVAAVKDAIQCLEAATEQPQLRSISVKAGASPK